MTIPEAMKTSQKSNQYPSGKRGKTQSNRVLPSAGKLRQNGKCGLGRVSNIMLIGQKYYIKKTSQKSNQYPSGKRGKTRSNRMLPSAGKLRQNGGLGRVMNIMLIGQKYYISYSYWLHQVAQRFLTVSESTVTGKPL